MDNDRDLRSSMLDSDDFVDPNEMVSAPSEVNDGRIFGLTAVERMILSIALFLTVTVLGVALLFITGTIVIR